MIYPFINIYMFVNILATLSYANDTEEGSGMNQTSQDISNSSADSPKNERISNTSTTFATIPKLTSTIVIDARSVLGTTNNTVIICQM